MSTEAGRSLQPARPVENSGLSRRRFFDRMTDGLCGAALLSLLGGDAVRGRVFAEEFHRSTSTSTDLAARKPHFAPQASSVIHLCMQGGPSQVDLFDPKPALKKYDGQPPPREVTEGALFERDRAGLLMNSPFAFAQHGEAGTWVSELPAAHRKGGRQSGGDPVDVQCASES